jgi:hypothetical protein
MPTALTWAATDNAAPQSLVDSTGGQTSFQVIDATGSGAGWNLTASATQFTQTSPPATLPLGSLTITGGSTSAAATVVPTGSCTTVSTCTIPTVGAGLTYPQTIATTATKIYSAAAATGLGAITVGVGALVVGWWLAVPATALAATYLSTVTITLATGP